MSKINVVIAAMAVMALFSCVKEVDESEKDELLRLEAYMSLYGSGFTQQPSGLYSLINEQGTGAIPANGNYILYKYEGKNLDGNVFETSNTQLAMLHDIYSVTNRYVSRFIEYKTTASASMSGLTEGISYLKEGGKATFIMPSSLAYGGVSYTSLPAYSSIIYSVELEKVVTDPAAYELENIHSYLDTFPNLVISEIFQDSVYFLAKIEGNGDLFVKDNEVEVNYIGSFMDGWVFDTNIDSVARVHNLYSSSKKYEPLKFVVDGNQVIAGFSRAVKHLRREGYAKVLLPSNVAYKTTGSGNIRPYEPIIFEIFVKTIVPVVTPTK
jgi:FKBP-type peptidyl-prolyl cis-trans isomerase